MKRFIETWKNWTAVFFFFTVSPSLKDRRENSALAVKLILSVHVNIKLFRCLQDKSWRVSIEYRWSQWLIIRDICFTGRVTWKINVYLMFPAIPLQTLLIFVVLLNWTQVKSDSRCGRLCKRCAWLVQRFSGPDVSEETCWAVGLVTWLLVHYLFCSEVTCGFPSIEGEKTTLSSQVRLFSFLF